ncbi:MAG TPA: M20/M25/M40 family metallo-hydrolase [Thermomicrobiales bacterium]|jgi:acetylornithine deacetylase/succinyl-diaminopimelate desuccinylase-like protein
MTIDGAAVGDEVIAHARALIRCDTTNPPGNESEAAAYLVAVARNDGLAAELVESAPGRGNAVARLRAVRPRARPLLLMGHLGGEVRDGFVWGRGALDMTGQVAAELTALLWLKRSGVVLDRDVVFAAFADEEVSTGEHGAIWMWRERRDLIDAEFALNEGGGWQSRVGPKRLYLCQVGVDGLPAVSRSQIGEGR